MDNNAPTVRLRERSHDSRAIISWDAEAYTIRIEFVRESSSTRSNYPLRDQIDVLTGAAAREFRVVVGDLDILCNEERRIVSMEMRRNPDQFRRETLDRPTGDLPSVELEFIGPFDSNDLWSNDSPVVVTIDSARRLLDVNFGPTGQAERWWRLCSNAAVSLTESSTLRRFRFDELVMLQNA